MGTPYFQMVKEEVLLFFGSVLITALLSTLLYIFTFGFGTFRSDVGTVSNMLQAASTVNPPVSGTAGSSAGAGRMQEVSSGFYYP